MHLNVIHHISAVAEAARCFLSSCFVRSLLLLVIAASDLQLRSVLLSFA